MTAAANVANKTNIGGRRSATNPSSGVATGVREEWIERATIGPYPSGNSVLFIYYMAIIAF